MRKLLLALGLFLALAGNNIASASNCSYSPTTGASCAGLAAPYPIQSTETVFNNPSTGNEMVSLAIQATAGDFLVFAASSSGSPTTFAGWNLSYSQNQIKVYTRTATGNTSDKLIAGATPGYNWVGVFMEFPATVSITGFAGNTNNYNYSGNGASIITPALTTPSDRSQLVVAGYYTSSGTTVAEYQGVGWTWITSQLVASEPGVFDWSVVPPGNTIVGSQSFNGTSLNTSYRAIFALTF